VNLGSEKTQTFFLWPCHLPYKIWCLIPLKVWTHVIIYHPEHYPITTTTTRCGVAIKTSPPTWAKWTLHHTLGELYQASETHFGPVNSPNIHYPLKQLVKGNAYFWLANHNDWHKWWHLSGCSLCIVHFSCWREGGGMNTACWMR